MSTQGQGDVVERLDARFNEIADYCAKTPASPITERAPEHMALYQDAKAEILRLRTLLSSSRGEQGWRTIDSAPKDGTWFLICRDDEGPESYEVGCFDPQIWKSYEPAENGLYRQVEKVVNEWRGFNNFHRATHWMPLPSAPGSVPTSNNTTINSALRTLANVWEMDGDLMRCRGCGRALIASLDGEALHHSAECKHKERGHPWTELRNILGAVPTSLAGQGPDDAKEDAAAAYFRSAIADGQAAVLLADLATYDNVLRELGIQESHKHPVDEVRRIQRVAETAHDQGVETAAKLIDRKVSDYTSEHGSLDPETGAMEFSLSGEEYVSTLEELAEEIRAINAAAPQPTAGGDANNG